MADDYYVKEEGGKEVVYKSGVVDTRVGELETNWDGSKSTTNIVGDRVSFDSDNRPFGSESVNLEAEVISGSVNGVEGTFRDDGYWNPASGGSHGFHPNEDTSDSTHGSNNGSSSGGGSDGVTRGNEDCSSPGSLSDWSPGVGPISREPEKPKGSSAGRKIFWGVAVGLGTGAVAHSIRQNTQKKQYRQPTSQEMHAAALQGKSGFSVMGQDQNEPETLRFRTHFSKEYQLSDRTPAHLKFIKRSARTRISILEGLILEKFGPSFPRQSDGFPIQVRKGYKTDLIDLEVRARRINVCIHEERRNTIGRSNFTCLTFSYDVVYHPGEEQVDHLEIERGFMELFDGYGYRSIIDDEGTWDPSSFPPDYKAYYLRTRIDKSLRRESWDETRTYSNVQAWREAHQKQKK